MIIYGLSKRNKVLFGIESLLSIITLLLSIKLLSMGVNLEFEQYIIVLFKLSLLLIYIYLLPIIFSSISVTEKGVIINSINTKILVNKEIIIDVFEYPQNILGLGKKYIQVKEKVQIYNRGLGLLLFFWYKTTDINISQFDEKVVPKIKTYIN